MSYQAIRDALESRLQAISSVGVVHAWPRLVRETPQSSEFQGSLVESGKLNVWMISRTGVRDRQAEDRDNRQIRVHEINIDVFWAWDDTGVKGTTSDTLFQNALEAVLDDIRTGDRTLGGAANTMSLGRVSTIEPVRYLSTLCHHAVIQLEVEEVF